MAVVLPRAPHRAALQEAGHRLRPPGRNRPALPDVTDRERTIGMTRVLLAALLLLPDGLSVEEFEKLHKDLQPPQGEAWRSIPWKTDLLEAQAAAAEKKKP